MGPVILGAGLGAAFPAIHVTHRTTKITSTPGRVEGISPPIIPKVRFERIKRADYSSGTAATVDSLQKLPNPPDTKRNTKAPVLDALCVGLTFDATRKTLANTSRKRPMDLVG